MPNKAVVLLSGGLDSATVLAIAQSKGYQCFALSFNYQQRSQAELNASKKIAKQLGVIEHKILTIDLSQFGGSALTDTNLPVPKVATEGIPITYVPARNTVFLSLALAYAEVLDAQNIFIGVNSVDYSGYPDCRPEYIKAFETMANLATKSAVLGRKININTPLINLSKLEIIKLGLGLGVDYINTVSCYEADESGRACGLCDSCRIRQAGFLEAGVGDLTIYQSD